MELVLGGSPDTHRACGYILCGRPLDANDGRYCVNGGGIWEGAARAALSQNQNHEAIGFGLKELRLLKEGMPLAGGPPGSNGHIETRIALTQEMLAEAYLADGKVHEAKEVILEALEVLDYSPPIGKEALRKRFRYEYKWLDRPVVIKQFVFI